jgi:hypothetical protein
MESGGYNRLSYGYNRRRILNPTTVIFQFFLVIFNVVYIFLQKCISPDK